MFINASITFQFLFVKTSSKHPVKPLHFCILVRKERQQKSLLPPHQVLLLMIIMIIFKLPLIIFKKLSIVPSLLVLILQYDPAPGQ